MSKTFLALSLCLILCASVAAATITTVKTIKEAILRSDSTVFSSEITRLAPETELTVLKERYDWYLVRLPADTVGFVHSDYIQTTGHRSGYATASSLNIRTGPSLDAEVIGTLKLRDEVEIIGRANAWYKIKAYPYASAWVNQKSVVIVSETEAEPPAEVVQETPEETPEEAMGEAVVLAEPEPAAPPETAAPTTIEEAPLEKITEMIQGTEETLPIATGILKPAGKFFSFVNYKLENENGVISLKIPVTLWPHQFLYKKVDIWGSFNENRNYLVVEKIKKSTETPAIKKVKEELRQINRNLKAAVDMPDAP